MYGLVRFGYIFSDPRKHTHSSFRVPGVIVIFFRLTNLEVVKSDYLITLRRGADKFLAFPFPIFLFAAQPEEFSLDGLKLEQGSHKCVELRGGICRLNTFFQSRSLLFSLQSQSLISPPHVSSQIINEL
jgi:hypothetical protein